MKNIILRKAIRRYLAENHEDLGIWSDFDSEEMMGAARREAMQDIESSGDNFVDLGKSEFEKDLSIEDMLKDLEDAKHGKTGMDLKRIQKQIDQIKRFGGGSLNETGLGIGNRDLTTGAAYNTPWEKKKREIAARKESENSFDKLMGQFKDNMEREMTPKNPSTETPEEKKLRIDTELKRLKNKETERQREVGDIEEGAESSRYMFFSNLEQMKKQAEELLALDENEVNEILENGHDWAQDHIATAKESMDQVYDFLMNSDKGNENEIEEGIGTGLEMKKGMNVKEEITDEGIAISLQNKKGMNVKPLQKNEGIGISLQNKKGMNVKPTNKK